MGSNFSHRCADWRTLIRIIAAMTMRISWSRSTCSETEVGTRPPKAHTKILEFCYFFSFGDNNNKTLVHVHKSCAWWSPKCYEDEKGQLIGVVKVSKYLCFTCSFREHTDLTFAGVEEKQRYSMRSLPQAWRQHWLLGQGLPPLLPLAMRQSRQLQVKEKVVPS